MGESLRIVRALGNKPDEGLALGQLAIIDLRLGDLAAAEHRAQASRQILESLGLKEVAKTYDVLFDIAEARGDTASAAEWARKRDAKLEELERLAGGGGGVPSQMLRALEHLAITCAQAGFGGEPLGLGAEEALAELDGFTAPLPEFSATLRQLAAGQIPSISTVLPTELRQLLADVVRSVREAQSQG